MNILYEKIYGAYTSPNPVNPLIAKGSTVFKTVVPAINGELGTIPRRSRKCGRRGVFKRGPGGYIEHREAI